MYDVRCVKQKERLRWIVRIDGVEQSLSDKLVLIDAARCLVCLTADRRVVRAPRRRVSVPEVNQKRRISAAADRTGEETIGCPVAAQSAVHGTRSKRIN